MQAGNITASCWLDRKLVTVMCTGVDPTKESIVQRTQKDGTRRSVSCPAAFDLYNKFMGGVDRGDQLRGYCHGRMKCRKFYKYIANFLLDTAITNAFILYRLTHPGSKCKSKKFRRILAKQLVGDYCSRRRAGYHQATAPSALPPKTSQHNRTKAWQMFTMPGEKETGGYTMVLL